MKFCFTNSFFAKQIVWEKCGLARFNSGPNKSCGRLKLSFANNHPYLSDGILIVQYNGVGSQKSSRSFTQGSLSVRILELGKKLPKVDFICEF